MNWKRLLPLALSLGMLCSMAVAAKPFADPGDELDSDTTYDILTEDNVDFEGIGRETDDGRFLVDDINAGNYTLEYQLTEGEEAVKTIRINAYDGTVELVTPEVIPVDGLVPIRGELTLTSRKRTNGDGSYKTLVYEIDFSARGDGADAAEETEDDDLSPSQQLLQEWGYPLSSSQASGETATAGETAGETARNPSTGRGPVAEAAFAGMRELVTL